MRAMADALSKLEWLLRNPPRHFEARSRPKAASGSVAVTLPVNMPAMICRTATRDWLIQDDDGKSLGAFGLRSRFDEARALADVDFQFRDIRAKATTDTGDLGHPQKLLGHRNREMTEHYVKQRVGERVRPLR